MKYIEILVKLRKIIRSINLESKKIEKELGVSIPQLLVLQYLSDQQDYRAFAKDIKSYINLNASTVSGIITRLESKGFVARLPEPNDKRATYITLTAKGADLLQKSPTTLQEKLSLKLKKLTPEQINELDRNIELLTTIMDVEDVDAAPLLTIKEITHVKEE
ncbi:MarR family winged helix-turn-helix transcriptional regulator [Aquimarina algicola]|uniref:MarR family transcriptional regulator n=1 Tax=Aquimarina algicola TaxID=2589995 RepID=A0A504J0Z3_9FLAO|nr:MarR family transcriptional regulator [Aquimarina algicola]TPN84497.1 MarR family transcriptional regulator [Aquimarina algicola]